MSAANERPLPVDPYGVAMLDVELAELLGRKPVRDVQTTQAALTDAELIAMRLADTFGPTFARRLRSRAARAVGRDARRPTQHLGR